MAITDSDRDAVVTALEEWTATTGEAYVRARALARQTDRSPKTVGTVLAALAGTDVRGVDLEPPQHLAISVWKENSEYATYRVVDTRSDASTEEDDDADTATDCDTPTEETTGEEPESDDDSALVTDGGQAVPTCPGCGGHVADVWNAETGACESCGEPLTDTAPDRDDAIAITNPGRHADSLLPRQRTRRYADSTCTDRGRCPDSEQRHARQRPVVTTAGSPAWPAVHAVVSQR
ncbi:hypothetical protein RYH80_15270 [Halobaculum sp. MBLA0147]|uniref:hypothetical protein n=1 Tax=Halobaculum sp. MBLA0147 TaxID=3079934 RepID=UPI0035251717